MKTFVRNRYYNRFHVTIITTIIIEHYLQQNGTTTYERIKPEKEKKKVSLKYR